MKFTASKEQAQALLYGLAIGDAYGTPFQFIEQLLVAKTEDRASTDSVAARGRLGPARAADLFISTTGLGNVEHDRAKGVLIKPHWTSCIATGVETIGPMPVGTWSDDTALTLATIDSLAHTQGRLDVTDMRARFLSWLQDGAYTPDHCCRDCGATVARALRQGYGCSGERDNGNGSLMRIAPLALTDASDAEIMAISAVTHAHYWSTFSCVLWVHFLRFLLQGATLRLALVSMLNYAQEVRGALVSQGSVITASERYGHERWARADPLIEIRVGESGVSETTAINSLARDSSTCKNSTCASSACESSTCESSTCENYPIERLTQVTSLSAAAVCPSGFVIDTLESALWALLNSKSFEKVMVHSCQFGGDTDSIAAVAGSAAGIIYGLQGEQGIPARYLTEVWGQELLQKALSQITAL